MGRSSQKLSLPFVPPCLTEVPRRHLGPDLEIALADLGCWAPCQGGPFCAHLCLQTASGVDGAEQGPGQAGAGPRRFSQSLLFRVETERAPTA